MLDFAVIGLGYVGLPLARAASTSGLRGIGLDTNHQIVTDLNSGRSHVGDLSDSDISSMLAAGFEATDDPSVLAEARVVVICVPTPLAIEGGPDLGAIRAATESVRDFLTQGTLVILESTTWPGTTEEVVRPILEASGLTAGVDFYLAYSPERIDPGNPNFGVENTPKVVGGFTDDCTRRATNFYSTFISQIVRAKGTKEAEMAKLLENTYRQVNIALVNEMAKFSHELGIDIWDVIDCAATKPFGYEAFRPGPGVGGHCIPIDPSYLSHRVQAQLGYPFRFVELAQEVNRSMPRYIVQRAQRLLNDQSMPVRGARILLLGVTYKPGIADQRESPAIPLATALAGLGADVRFYDPFVANWHLDSGMRHGEADLLTACEQAQLIIHLQPHPNYSLEVLDKIRTPILDTRGVLTGKNVEAL